MRICVVGLGYIGLPTACLLAQAGHEVVCVDKNAALINDLRQGRLHIVNEPALEDIAKSVLASGSLTVATTPVESDAFILCVPTPFQAEENSHRSLAETAATTELLSSGENGNVEALPAADLSFVVSATRAVAPLLRPGNLVVLESTVPPGTTEQVVLPTLEEFNLDLNQIHVAHAPERVLPGAIVQEMIRNDRIIGGVTREAADEARKLYASFVQGEILTTDATTAEFTKLVENAFRDVNIAFANELARVSQHLGIDVGEVISLANHHPRVNILKPGPGVGGHCIAVDPYFIIQQAQHLTPLLRAARTVNRAMPYEVVETIKETVSHASRVALLGAAYKGNVGDDRESPSHEVARLLVEQGYQVVIHDPHVEQYRVPLEDVIRNADIVTILTDHDEYRKLDPKLVASMVRHKVVLDTRRVLDAAGWEGAGFRFHRLGDGRRSPRLSGTKRI